MGSKDRIVTGVQRGEPVDVALWRMPLNELIRSGVPGQLLVGALAGQESQQEFLTLAIAGGLQISGDVSRHLWRRVLGPRNEAK